MEHRVCDVCQEPLLSSSNDMCVDCHLFLYEQAEVGEDEEERCDRCMGAYLVLTMKQCHRCKAKFNLCQWCPFHGICPPYFGCFCYFTNE